MVNKSFLLVLVLAVAAAEGRARGSKLGHRSFRQFNFWAQQNRQDAASAGAATSPAGSYPSPAESQGSYPTTATGAPPSTGQYQQPGSSGAGGTSGSYQPLVVSPGTPVHPSVCKAPGFYATPGSCVNFYRCVDLDAMGTFVVYQFNCPAGTIFDESLSICNHIWITARYRPECADMLNAIVPPVSFGPAPGAGAGGYPQGGAGAGGYPQGGAGAGGYPQGGAGAGVPGGYPGAGSSPSAGGAYPQPGGGPQGPSSDGLFSMTCSTDGKYKRHPLFCNRYYRCMKEESDYVFKTLTCPQDFLFDDASQQCTDPSLTAQCLGELAPYPTAETVAPPTDSSTGEGATDSPSELPLDPNSQYACSNEGYYPFEHDCVRFYKCSVTTENTLIGYRYKCPDGYGYSDEKQRCASDTELAPCDKAPLPASLRGSFPAIELSVAQLRWFFDY